MLIQRKQNIVPNKIGVFYIDNFWSVDSLNLNQYAPKINERFR